MQRRTVECVFALMVGFTHTQGKGLQITGSFTRDVANFERVAVLRNGGNTDFVSVKHVKIICRLYCA